MANSGGDRSTSTEWRSWRYGVTLGGVIAALFSLVEAAFAPGCPAQPSDVIFDFCTSASDALRGALNAGIVVVVAGAV